MNKKIFWSVLFSFVFGLSSLIFANTANAGSITSISPTYGRAGDTVTITGEGFENVNGVYFSLIDAGLNFKVVSSTKITAVVPEGSASGKITILTLKNGLRGSIISPGAFTAIDKNKITTIKDFSPTSGKVGTEVTINGTYLDNVEKVLFDSTETVTRENTPSKIVVLVPKGASTGLITVKTKYYGTATSPSSFVVTKNGTNPTTGGTVSTTTSSSGSSSSTTTEYSGLVPKCNTGDIDTLTGKYKNPCDFNYFMKLINKIIQFLLYDIATPLVAIIIMYVAYLFLSAGGSTEKVSKAKKIFINVVVGYAIALSAWLIVNTILTSLNVDSSIETFLK